MKFIAYIVLFLALSSGVICPAVDIQRFPPPDFDSSYTLPTTETPSPRAGWFNSLDVIVLFLSLGTASFLALQRRRRPGLFMLSIFCLIYFGFYREGCICPIGSIQNVTLALFNDTYTLPLTVALFFLLPLIFSLFFGRVFCAGVCPLGAIQDLVLIKPVKVPLWLQQALSLLAYIYLGFAVFFAALGSAFVICKYDPFVTFFRLSGNTNIVVLSVSLLVISLFVGRPYCRFLCPYSVLLKFFSRFTQWRVTITPDECIQCRLCEDACPFGAITCPTPENAPAPGTKDRKRLVGLLILVPLLILLGGGVFSLAGSTFSKMHFTVRLAEQIALEETGHIEEYTEASKAFRASGRPLNALYEEAGHLRKQYVWGGWFLGGFLGLVIACKLIRLSTFRRRIEYEANPAECVACGRCFSYCPSEWVRRKEIVPLVQRQEKATIQDVIRQVTEIKNTQDRPWFKTARNTAIVSGVFSLLIAVLLIGNHIKIQSDAPEKGPFFSSVLAEQKNQINANPRDEERKDQYRNLDLEVRREYFRRMAFSKRGEFLLLIGILAFLFSMKKLVEIQKSLPMPVPGEMYPNLDASNKMQARKAVGFLSLLLFGSVFSLALIPRINFPSFSTDASSPTEKSSTAPSVSGTADYPSAEEIEKNWPRFRGPSGIGIATSKKIPTSWDGVSGQGILWKKEIPLPGANSPVVWGNKVFISGADESNKEVYCYSLDSGEILWRKTVQSIPDNSGEELKIFEDTGYAPSTMACDGKHLYAIFVDGNLVCFDLDGQQLWAKNLGIPNSSYGYATSLTFYQNLLLIQLDQGAEDDDLSKLFALEGQTGNIVWQKVRPVANSWTSPILIKTDTGEQLITVSEPWVIAYRPGSGDEIWRANVMSTDLASSPIFANGLVFVIRPNDALVAIRPDGTGDVTDTHVAWKIECPGPDICSPVSNGELIFLLCSSGDFSCYETKTGELVWDHIFDDMFQSSPTLVGEWIYLMSEKGITYRVKAARKLEIAEETSHVDEWLRASPAFVDSRIVIRGDMNLYCIGTK